MIEEIETGDEYCLRNENGEILDISDLNIIFIRRIDLNDYYNNFFGDL